MNSVTIITPARIHCSLINETGISGRIDGGIGFSISKPYWKIKFEIGNHFIDPDNLCDEHYAAIDFALDKLRFLIPKEKIRITISESIPCHIGLGSKTSLLLSIGKALSLLSDNEISAYELCRILKRGGTSGIGLYSFEGGKFIWDNGHKYPEEKNCFGPSSLALALPPQEILSYPINWLEVIHLRFSTNKIFGIKENSIFKDVCPVPQNETINTIECVCSKIIPSILGKNNYLLQEGIKKLQNVGFKKYEWLYQDDITKKFKDYWDSLDMLEGIGLSSMGPTLYILTTRPKFIHEKIKDFEYSPIYMCETEINNEGAKSIIGSCEKHEHEKASSFVLHRD